MNNKEERMAWLVALVLGLGVVGVQNLPGVQPYSDVRVVEVEPSERGFFFVADFTKIECEFQKLFAFGLSGGVPTNLPYEDVDPQFTDQDRPAGDQRLSIEVLTLGVDYDALQIRTRHNCDGEKVDRIFATVEVSG